MDKKREIVHTLIETAVEKGIRDIKENSNRGTRNLVDLGMHFVKGRFQKNFFRIAQQMLDNENCPYYRLVDNIIRLVDPEIIKHFCVNIGYNSWTYGAEKIREYEKKHGYNIPWTIIFNFSEDTENRLSDDDVSRLLHAGESMGVYCGMFFAGRNKSELESLVRMLAAHKDGGYFIFLNPELITDDIAKATLDARNIAIVLAVDPAGDAAQCGNAVEILQKNRCMYGTFCLYNDDNVKYITSGKYLRQIEALRCTFVFFVRQSLNVEQNVEYFSRFMQSSRNVCRYQFFIADFYEDIANVDKIISVEDCFLAIKGNGSITASKSRLLGGDLPNIRSHSLQSILRKIMPRTQYV